MVRSLSIRMPDTICSTIITFAYIAFSGVGTSSVENRVWELLAQDELYIVVTQVPQLYETFLETRWLDVRNNDSVKSWVLDLLTT